MAEIGSAFLSILPSAKGFGSKLETDVGNETKGAGKKIGTGFGKVFAVAAGAVAAVGIADFLGGAIADAQESQKITALTEQVIKTTGSAAKVTSQQVQDLAGSIAEKTGIDDAAIQSASNLLLTFTNLRNEVGKGNDIFNQATRIATDMATALGQEPKAAAIGLGKALNDPIKGVTALSKVGVSFTQEQKDLIKTLVEGGDTMKAQKVILKELGKEFGGAAEAQATAADKAAFAFGELKESIGTALLPVIEKFSQFAVSTVIPTLQKITDAFIYLFSGGEEGARGFAEILDNALGNTGRFIDPITQITEVFQTVIATSIQVRKEIASRLQPVFEAFGNLIKNNPTFVKAFAVALGVLVTAIGAVTLATTLFSIALNSTGIPLLIIGIALLVAGLVVAYKRSSEFRNIVNQVGAGIKSFASFVRTSVVPVVVSLAQTIGQRAKPVLKQLGQTFRADILPTIQKVVAKFREMQPTIQRVIGVVVRVVAVMIKFYVTMLSKVLPVLIRFAGFIFSRGVPAVVAYIGVIVKIIGKIVEFGAKVVAAVKQVGKFVTGLKQKFGDALTFMQTIPLRAVTALGGLGQTLVNAGKELIQGLIDGITSKISALQDKMKDLGNKIKGFLPGSPVKEGPLKSWNHGNGVSGAGRRLVDGITQGISARKKGAGKAMGGLAISLMDGLKDGLTNKQKEIVKAIKTVIGAFKSEFDTLKGASKDLSASIADAFRPDLLSGNLADFFSVGEQGKSGLQQVIAAFAKLRKFGLSAAFLSDLYASGNSGLILDLASSDKATAKSAESLFNQNASLATQLGNKVAGNEYAPQFENLGNRFEKAIDRLGNRADKQTVKQAQLLAAAINGAATRGRRNARVA